MPKPYQPPTGGRDLLPLDVVQKRWIEDRLEQVFQRWGYHRIITSTVETMDTLMAGGAIERVEVIELQLGQAGQQRLGLRPELTASIARAAVTRLASVTYPQRLYYNANVFRRLAQGSQGNQQEYHQAGIELLGAKGLMADAETILLAADCLSALNITDARFVIGEAALTYSLLSVFPDEIRETVRRHIAALDMVALSEMSLSDELRDRVSQLMSLRGEPATVLIKLSQLDLTDEQSEIVNRLKSLIELLSLEESQGTNLPPIVLDLSLIRPFDYYTGIVFEIASDNSKQMLGQGGRYDELLAVYDTRNHTDAKGFPGIGFVLNIEQLQQTLVPSGQLPSETPPSDWLIVPEDESAAAAALAYAQKARQTSGTAQAGIAQTLVRVEMCLDLQQSKDEVRAIARKRNISRIAWISNKGLPDIEVVN
ncbi:MAG: ATP phosphoribosyltransferase regulatory subunit [Cyanobacteria bacterium P01_D01_bin.105]